MRSNLRGTSARSRASTAQKPAPPAMMVKEPSIAHGIPLWEQPQKMTMASDQDGTPLIASSRRRITKESAVPLHKERLARLVPAEQQFQRRPTHMVITFNREDSCCLSLGDITCDQSEIPLFQEKGNSVQQQRYSISPVPSPQRSKPNRVSTTTSYQSPSKQQQVVSSPPRSPPTRRAPPRHLSSCSPPRKEAFSSPRRTASQQHDVKRMASGGDIVLDVMLPRQYVSQEKVQKRLVTKPQTAGEIVVNLSQAPLNRESSDVVIPSFGKPRANCKTIGSENPASRSNTQKKPNAIMWKKPVMLSDGNSRPEKSTKPGASFFPPAPLHDSNDRSSSQPRLIGDESSHSSRPERASWHPRDNGDDMMAMMMMSSSSHSSNRERPPAQRHGCTTTSARRQSRVDYSRDEAHDANSTTEFTVQMGSSFGGSAYEISIDCDSVDEGLACDNAETAISAEDMALLAQEDEMIALALERSMHECSLNESNGGLSITSGDGSIQSKQSDCRSLRAAFRGKQRQSESRLMSVEEPSDSDEEDDTFRMGIAMSRANFRDSRRTDRSESLAVLDLGRPGNSTMDDSNYSRYDSAHDLDASRVSRFNDSRY